MADVTTIPIIKQGDEYNLLVELKFNGETISEEHLPLLAEIEFALGDLEPVHLNPARCFSKSLGKFLFPITQEQTFELEQGRTDLDIRVQFVGGNVVGIKQKLRLKVADATSENVLNASPDGDGDYTTWPDWDEEVF